SHVCLSLLQAICTPGRQLYSRSEILATDEYSRAAHISRVVQTSKQAARAAGADEGGLSFPAVRFSPLPPTQCQCLVCLRLMVQKVLQELKLYYGNEEEEDRAGKVEKGTKVKRTLSSLRNRVTGSFNKDKGKNREKELHRVKERDREAKGKVCRTTSSSTNGHHLVPGSFSSSATCSLCSKSLQKKHGLQCMSE
ncbi:hypothetical protein XENOCAPTIV_003853, partial [Xenoophorus captivus]